MHGQPPVGLSPCMHPTCLPTLCTGDENKRFPTGSNEYPYIVYLLTMYPAMLAVILSVVGGMLPYVTLNFAFSGHKKVLAKMR
jgi:hypothetical protein